MNIFRIVALTAVMTLGAVGCWGQCSQGFTIDDLFTQLERNDAELQVARTALEVASEGVIASRRQRLPDIDVGVSASFIGNIAIMDRDFSNVVWYDAPHYGNRFSLAVNQMLYTGGALTAGVRMAELEQALTAQQLALTGQQRRFVAVGLFLDLYTLANCIGVFVENIALTRTLIVDIAAMEEQGLALRNDVTRYELQLSNLLLGKRKVEDLMRVKNRELCVMIGLAEGTTIVPEVDETLLARETMLKARLTNDNDWQGMAIEYSPQRRMASLSTELSEQGVRMARSELLPKVNVFAVESLEGPITFEIPAIDSNLNTWYLGVGLSWGLGALYKGRHKLRAARTALRESREQELVVGDRLSNAVFAAEVDYEQSFVELATRRDGVRLAQENYDVVNERYLNQLALITDMLDASNTKLNAELSVVNAQINTIYQLYKLKYVSGTL